jgi:hypothetical protein
VAVSKSARNAAFGNDHRRVRRFDLRTLDRCTMLVAGGLSRLVGSAPGSGTIGRNGLAD